MNSTPPNTDVEKKIDEHWLPIEGFEGLYEVSNFGQVRSTKRMGTHGGIVKQSNWSKAKYQRVGLCKDKLKINYLVHRLVATAFIRNGADKLEVNHIDGNKLNNTVTNLEWCTRAENNQHAIDTGLWKPRRRAQLTHQAQAGGEE